LEVGQARAMAAIATSTTTVIAMVRLRVKIAEAGIGAPGYRGGPGPPDQSNAVSPNASAKPSTTNNPVRSPASR
jgi:hypothetical protein